MTQETPVLSTEPNEKPIELMTQRLDRVNLAFAQLQRTNTSLITTNMALITEMQRDVVFCLRLLELLQQHVPAAELQNAITVASTTVPAVAERLAIGDHGAANIVGEFVEVTPETTLKQTSPVEITPPSVSLGAAALSFDVVEPAPLPPAVRTVPTRPTRAVKPAVEKVEQGKPEDYIGHFLGSGSVFTKFLSPTVLTGGRGFTEPGYGGFEQYEQDVTHGSPLDLREWPSGFYMDAETGLRQLFIASNKLQVTVTNLPNTDLKISVSLSPFTERADIHALNVQQLQLVYGIISTAFLTGEQVAAKSPTA